MKKLIVFFILVFFSVPFVKAKTDSEYIIDKVLGECTTENYMTSGMNQCIYDGIEAWNNEINQYSKQIVELLDDENIKVFKAAQLSWEFYYNKEKDFLYKTVYEKEGDIHTTFVIGDMYELVKHRAVTLKKYLFQLTEN